MITTSAGEDPATCSVRMNCLDGSYDYMERVMGQTDLICLITDLFVQLRRIDTYVAWRDRQKSKDSSNPI